MSEKPVILITKPEKQLIEKDNFEIEINNYDNSHLYYKGFDLGTFKEIVNLKKANGQLKDNWNDLKQDIGYELLKLREPNEYNKGLCNAFNYINNKMQELEQGSDSNVKD